MEQLSFAATVIHRQRMRDLMDEARGERHLRAMKRRDAEAWLQRRYLRNRKNI